MKNKSYKILVLRIAPSDLELGLGVLYRFGITSLEQKRNREGLWLIARLPFETSHREIMNDLFHSRSADTGRRIFSRLRCQTVLKGRWAEQYKKHLKPFLLVPKTKTQPALWVDPRGGSQKKGKVDTFRIEQGLAFGTGNHPTTGMSAELLSETLEGFKKPVILDMGCGTAILSMVAIKRGAQSVWGVDVDPIALEVAEKNLRQNRIRNVVLKDSLVGCRRKFDGIVANILLDALLSLKKDFLKYLKPRGFLILSGIRYQDCEELLKGYGEFSLIERRSRKGWSAFLFKKD